MSATTTKVSTLTRWLWIANLIFHQAIAVVIIYTLYVICVNANIDSLNTWHMILTSVGVSFYNLIIISTCFNKNFQYVLLMVEGIILFTAPNLYTLYIPRTKNNTIHFVILGVSVVLITIGIAFRINLTAQRGSKHFVSIHAITGNLIIFF